MVSVNNTTNYDNLYIYTKDLVTPYDFIKGLQSSNEYFIAFVMWENTMVTKDQPNQFKNLDEINNPKVVETLFKLCWGKDAQVPKDWKRWNPKPFQNTTSKCLGFYLISTSGNNNNALNEFVKKVKQMNVYEAIHIPPIIQKLKPYESPLYKKQDECITIDYDQDLIPVIQDIVSNYYSKTFLPVTKLYSLIGDKKRIPDILMTKMDPDIKRNIKIFYLPNMDERDELVDNLLGFDNDLKQAFTLQKEKLIGDAMSMINCINSCNKYTMPQVPVQMPNQMPNQTSQQIDPVLCQQAQDCINNCLNNLQQPLSTTDAPAFKDLLNTGFSDNTDIIYDSLGNPILNAKPTDDMENIFERVGSICKSNNYSYIQDFNLDNAF